MIATYGGKTGKAIFLALLGLMWAILDAAVLAQDIKNQGEFTGTQSCRECHEKFYKLWAPSHHGKAMQPYSDHFAAASLSAQAKPIVIRGLAYLAQTGSGQGWVLEKGPDGDKQYPIKHALGGKNVFYFLTPMDKGRLQTLPLAYDLNKQEWFDTAKSGLRHAGDAQLPWTDAAYTFNTACHSCHVSQYRLNYDLKSDTYQTTWAEPGINCETCHGPGEEHIRVCKEAPKGTLPEDLKIIRGGRSFTTAQNNATCSSCHAKMMPLTSSFKPGDKFYDHFDLALLEHGDYYPDGRDLGENYTFTSWSMSPCVEAGDLNCLHCHTSSGRFRQKKEPNQACMPCHADRVRNSTQHTRHKPESKGNQCISCHMPITSFARMKRSDHSMLPPTPAATIKYGSPNACTNCHPKEGAVWADQQVRQWRKRDYQAPVLHRAGLIKAARERDWSRLDEMLAYIEAPQRDQVFVASLIRLLRSCPDAEKWPAMIKATRNPSPLVRASAAECLRDNPSLDSGNALLALLSDEFRLVRIRAAGSIISRPNTVLWQKQKLLFTKAVAELEASLVTRPDLWNSHYNLGNYLMELGRLRQAVGAYEWALKLEPRAVRARVNLAMAFARLGESENARAQLASALEQEPQNAAANFNMGLLAAEQKKPALAERHLRAALKSDPRLDQAAYNLGLLIHRQKPAEGLKLLSQAWEQHPNPRYGFSLGYMLNQQENKAQAASILKTSIERWPWYGQAYLLLAEIQESQGQSKAAMATLREGIRAPSLKQAEREYLQRALAGLLQNKPPKPQ